MNDNIKILTNKAKRYLVKNVKEKGVFFGSRMLKVETENSDYDYLVLKRHLVDILYYIELHHPEAWEAKQIFDQTDDSCNPDENPDFYSIIVYLDDKKYNFISPYSMSEYKVYRMAIKSIKKFINCQIIIRKQDRVDLFECFKEIYRRKYINFRKVELKEKPPECTKNEIDVPF